jgi:hypothetical protein
MIIPAKEYRKHAAACLRLARVATDDSTRVVWERLAKRWELCAELAERENSSAHRLGPYAQGPASIARQAVAGRA